MTKRSRRRRQDGARRVADAIRAAGDGIRTVLRGVVEGIERGGAAPVLVPVPVEPARRWPGR